MFTVALFPAQPVISSLNFASRCLYGVRGAGAQPSKTCHSIQLSRHTVRECQIYYSTGNSFRAHSILVCICIDFVRNDV